MLKEKEAAVRWQWAEGAAGIHSSLLAVKRLLYHHLYFAAAQNLPRPGRPNRGPPQHVPASEASPSRPVGNVSLPLEFSAFHSHTLFSFLLFIVLFWQWRALFFLFSLNRQLRRQLSLSMISKLLDGKCTYTPTDDKLTVTWRLCLLLTATVEHISKLWPSSCCLRCSAV